MSFELGFLEEALKEWRKLDSDRREHEVRDNELIVLVIAVGRRDREAVYRAADRR